MKSIKYIVNGLLFAALFTVGFNLPHWLGLSDTYITVGSGK